MNYTSRDRAVSPVVAVILMVAITVVLSAAVGALVLDLGQTTTDGRQSDIATRTTYNDDGTATVQLITGTADELEIRVDGTAVKTLADPAPGDTATVTATKADTLTVVATTDGATNIVSTTGDTAPTTAPTTVSETWTYDAQPSGLISHSTAELGHPTQNAYTADYAANYTIEIAALNQPTTHEFLLGNTTNGVSIALSLDDSSYQEEKLRIIEWDEGNYTTLYTTGNVGANGVSVGDRMYLHLQYNATDHVWRARAEFTDGTLPYPGYESGWVAGGNHTTSDLANVTYFAHGSNANVQYDGTNNRIEMYADRGWGPYSRVYVESANISSELP